jgi:hypothetical protein
MVIKGQWKRDSDYKKNSQHSLFVQMSEEQTKEVDDQNESLSRNHVRHDCAYEESFLAFEGHVAGSAVRFEIKGTPENTGLTASRALQFETPPQREDDRARISFHRLKGD